jgi:two-component system sensor histidine kinase DesK
VTENGPQPPAPAGQLEARWRWGWVFASVWLVYLAEPVRAAWLADRLLSRVVGLLALVLFGLLYLWTWTAVRGIRRSGRPIGARLAVLTVGGSLLLTVVALLTAGESALAMTVFVAVMAMFVLPLRPAVGLVAGLLGTVELLPRLVPGWERVDLLGFQIVVSAVAMWGVLQLVTRNAQLARAQAEIARLAVARERDRFARDLHDVLGHSLTVVSVKAELAARLVGTDPERAGREMEQVQQLARDALADVRTAVAGYRETSLAGELVAARAALDAAGIDAELPGAVDHVPGDRRELFGWVVREGVTNVIRHSRATRCQVVLEPDAVLVADDGAGPPEPADPGPGEGSVQGHGLAGLRERAEAAGASVRTGRSDLGGFGLRVGW